MADIDHLDPPAPRSTDHWTLPKVVRIEGDGMNPRNTRLLDDATGEEFKLPIQSLQFNVNVDQPNSMELILGEVAIRATVHHVQYTIHPDDLAMLAKQNGFRIERVPAYPARMSSYGPTEIQVTFRDFPDMQPVINRNIRRLEAIEAAEAALHAHLQSLKADKWPIPAPTEPVEGEFLIWAHEPTPEFDEVEGA